MSVVSPKVRFVQNQLRDLFSAPMILASAKRAQHRDRLIGDELIFDGGLTSSYSKCNEFAATTVEPDVCGGDLPLHSRHRPIKRSDFDHVMHHVALSHTEPELYSNSGLQRQEARDTGCEVAQ
jgi:hypothetical protein